MTKLIKNFVKNESGATAIEYGLIAAIVGIGIVVGLGTLKTNLNTTFTNVGTTLSNNNTAGAKQ